MDNHPTKHRTIGTEGHQSPDVNSNARANHARANHTGKKGRFAKFLIDSGVKPLVFMGRCVQYFGLRAVAGFLLGAVAVYGYACFKPLPFAKTQSKTVQLHGVVRDSQDRPVKDDFYVGVLANQFGPVHNSDGSFVLEVPQSNSYDVALWNRDTVKVFYGFAAEPDGNGYKLQQALPFLQTVPNVSAQYSKPGAQLAQMQLGGR